MYRNPEDAGQMTDEAVVSAPAAQPMCLGKVASQFEALARAHDMDFFLVTTFPKADKPEFEANFVIGNWPLALREAYDAVDVYGFSRLIGLLKQSVKPVFTAVNLFGKGQNCGADDDLADLFVKAGLETSFAFSLHDAELNHYVVVFSGRRSKLPATERAELYVAALDLIDNLRRNRAAEQPREKLSARELECLRWSAAGKSSEEIAVILNISGHTVISYLKSAMRKLDSVNRMQAVARACRFRIL